MGAGGAVTISGRMATWLGGIAAAALLAGAGAAWATYEGVGELGYRMDTLSSRVAELEDARAGDGRERQVDTAALDARMRSVETGLAEVNATLRMLVETRR